MPAYFAHGSNMHHALRGAYASASDCQAVVSGPNAQYAARQRAWLDEVGRG